ncbi:MAG: DUF503 domain-containing protein [Anaerolineaceae bacterium]
MKTDLFNQPISIDVGLLTIYFHIPDSHSLKDKRSAVKPILARLQNEFKISAAEIAFQDRWQECLIACSIVSSDPAHITQVLQNVYQYVMDHFHHIIVSDHRIEIL